MLPSSIELRLLEMQRKLSAIAEIPKILSSTLATVSQSFGSLSCEEELYRRKCSYDEDALDYELNEGDETDEEEEEQEEQDERQQAELQLQLEHFKSKSVRDGTPESDYASEANYAVNGTHDEQEEEEEDASEQEEEQLETVYYVRLPAACVAAGSDDEARRQEQLESVTDAEDSDSDDFLSTSYTWNLRNVPKLRINDATTSVRNLTLSPQLKPETHNAIDISKVRAATPTPTHTPQLEQREAQVTSGQPAAVASACSTSQKVKQSMRRLIRDAYDIVAFAAALQAG